MAHGSTRPLVLQAEELSTDAQDFLRERFDFTMCRATDEPRFSELLSEAAALIVRTYTRVDAGLLARAPRLRVVGRAGVGLTNIDVAACRARGVEVVHTPDANSQAVAELVLAFLLDAYRPRLFLDSALAAERWSLVRADLVAARELSELTVGIIGLGRVGSRVARVLAALGSRVVYHDLLHIPEHLRAGAKPLPLDAVLHECHAITLHVDDRASNARMVDDAWLARLRPDATLINTSRGSIADPHAIARWLLRCPAARAVLDVHEPEPIDAANPLLGIPNAHLSPHIGAATRRAHDAMSWVVRDVARVLEGEKPEFPAPRTM